MEAGQHPYQLPGDVAKPEQSDRLLVKLVTQRGLRRRPVALPHVFGTIGKAPSTIEDVEEGHFRHRRRVGPRDVGDGDFQACRVPDVDAVHSHAEADDDLHLPLHGVQRVFIPPFALGDDRVRLQGMADDCVLVRKVDDFGDDPQAFAFQPSYQICDVHLFGVIVYPNCFLHDTLRSVII